MSRLPVLPASRPAARFALALMVLFALLPAGGLKVCLGHDGHLGLGSVAASAGCPCEHGADGAEQTGAQLAQQRAPATGESHAPCEDLALEAPDVLVDQQRDSLLARALDVELAVAWPAVDPGGSRLAPAEVRSALRPPVPREVSRAQLELQRVVVLRL